MQTLRDEPRPPFHQTRPWSLVHIKHLGDVGYELLNQNVSLYLFNI